MDKTKIKATAAKVKDHVKTYWGFYAITIGMTAAYAFTKTEKWKSLMDDDGYSDAMIAFEKDWLEKKTQEGK